jgi:hypothetical protein
MTCKSRPTSDELPWCRSFYTFQYRPEISGKTWYRAKVYAVRVGIFLDWYGWRENGEARFH